MRRLVALLPLAALAAAIALFAGWSLKRSPQVSPAAMVGKPAPMLSLVRLDGHGRAPPGALAKGPALVNFFASWCAPCAVESPALMALKAEGVRIVGVAYQDDPNATRAFLARMGNPYAQVLSDPDGAAAVEFGLSGVPETYAIDARGVIRAKLAAPVDEEGAESLLAAARS